MTKISGKPVVLIDASVLIAATLKETGASRVIFDLAGKNFIEIILTDLIFKEAHRNLKAKYGSAELLTLFQLLKDFKEQIKPHAEESDYSKLVDLIEPKDFHILVAAQKHQVDYLITLDKKHFFTNKLHNAKLSFQILLPGDFLSEFRDLH